MSTVSPSTILLDEYHALLVAAEESESSSDGEGSPLNIGTISWSNQGANATEIPPISPLDTLVVVDMQHDFLPGGAFGVDEGDAVIEGICELIQRFHEAGATVLASRDYHPTDHCSFQSHGGPFPTHCVMGTRGSFFHPRIAETLQPLLALAQNGRDGDDKSNTNRNTHVIYKGFYKGVESFGGFPYSSENDKWKERLSHQSDDAVDWTGGYALKASNIGADANASPDVLSFLDKKPSSSLLPTSNEGEGRVFCCGLAMDYCVLDTAVNFVQTVQNNNSCFLVQDLTRAARIPGVGAFGSGFLTDPSVLLESLKANKIGLVRFTD